MEPTEFWNDRYASQSSVWSGRANQVLAEVAADFVPGRALDLGCGEGGDALWLAGRGWQVTAVDIAAVALERGRAAAQAAEVPEDRIAWLAQDLTEWVPVGQYDLVSACFLQSPIPLNRTEILRRAAQATADGGHLLVVAHAAAPPWSNLQDEHHHDFPTPESELSSLALAAGEWQILAAEVRTRSALGPDGQAADLADTVVLAQRAGVLERRPG